MSYSSFSSSSLSPSSSPVNHRDEIAAVSFRDEIAAASFRDAIREEIRARYTRLISGIEEIFRARDKVAERRVAVAEKDVRPRISSEKPDSEVVQPPTSSEKADVGSQVFVGPKPSKCGLSEQTTDVVRPRIPSEKPNLGLRVFVAVVRRRPKPPKVMLAGDNGAGQSSSLNRRGEYTYANRKDQKSRAYNFEVEMVAVAEEEIPEKLKFGIGIIGGGDAPSAAELFSDKLRKEIASSEAEVRTKINFVAKLVEGGTPPSLLHETQTGRPLWHWVRRHQLLVPAVADELVAATKSDGCQAQELHKMTQNDAQTGELVAKFLQDNIFRKDEWIELWIEEGYVLADGHREAEDVGNEFLDDLLMRSFLYQDSSWKWGARYSMHALIHDLAEFVTKEDCIRMKEGTTLTVPQRVLNSTSHALPRMAGFSSFVCHNMLTTVEVAGLFTIKSLRTFLFLGLFPYRPHRQVLSQANLDLLLQFKCLRVLKLEHSGLEELPDCIGGLEFLKFFDLSYNKITQLPPSLCSLYHLQRLKLKDCNHLIELPDDTRQLINLRYLDTDKCPVLAHMPPQIGNLRKLQLLSRFVSGKEIGQNIAELKDLTNLRLLGLSGLASVVTAEEATEADLKNKNHLNQLHLYTPFDKWDQDKNESSEAPAGSAAQGLCREPLKVGFAVTSTTDGTLLNQIQISVGYQPAWARLPLAAAMPFHGITPTRRTANMLVVGYQGEVANHFKHSPSHPQSLILAAPMPEHIFAVDAIVYLVHELRSSVGLLHMMPHEALPLLPGTTSLGEVLPQLHVTRARALAIHKNYVVNESGAVIFAILVESAAGNVPPESQIVYALGCIDLLSSIAVTTIVLCSWDAEEFGMIGSTEWVEENLENLRSKVVAYLNVDCIVQGPGIFAGASPQLDDLLLEVVKKVNDSNVHGKTVYQTWTLANNGTHIERLSEVDSNFAACVQRARVPSVDLYDGPDFPLYHTAIDTFEWMKTSGDPLFHSHMAVAEIWGLLTLHLADSSVLPFNYLSYVAQLQEHRKPLSSILDRGISSYSIDMAIQELIEAAHETEKKASYLGARKALDAFSELRTWMPNDPMMLSERGFMDAEGLTGRLWFKHLRYGPPGDSNSELSFFPGIADAISQATKMSKREGQPAIDQALWRVASALQRAALSLLGTIT